MIDTTHNLVVPRQRRLKTSISVERELWRQFGAKLTLAGRDYSQGVEDLLRKFLGQAEGSLPALPPTSPHSPEISALLAWYQHPPKRFDKALKSFLRERLEELRAAQAGNSKENAG